MANEEPTDLLNALESIKGLLERSETKLNAARESIESATPLPTLEQSEPAPVDEPIEVPVLNDIVVPPDAVHTSPTVDIAVLKAFLDEMQSTIEKNMRSTLMKAVVQAEGDIKKQMNAYLDQLRKMIDEQSN